MDKKCFIVLLILLPILTCCTLSEQDISTPIPTMPLPSPESPCGDGVCDDVEQRDSSLCPQDCVMTEVPPTDTPKSPDIDSGKSPCGDGVCDEMEQANPSVCPIDCPEEETSRESPAMGNPDYEPPINIFLVLHSDPDMAIESFTFSATPVDYQRTHDGFDWLMEEAARHDLKFSALYNGWYPMEALETGDLSQFQSLLDAGHEIGTHAHRLTYDPEEDLWTAHVEDLSFYGRPNYDSALARQTWDDATHYVEEVLQAIGVTGQNQTMSTRSFQFSDEGILMDEYGFTVAAGGRAELGIKYFGHAVWNPWKPASNDEIGHEIEEDLNASFITIDHLAQIGADEVSHPVDLSIPQLQRRFLMLYTEWLTRVRTGADDKIWTFGFVYHPNYTDRYLDDLSEFLDWLDENFIGKTTSQGYTIARYATIGEIAQEFMGWEAANPGVSSFNYVRGDPYPYTYEFLPTMLDGAAYEQRIDLGEGVTCFRLSKDGKPIYLLWSDQQEQIVDLSQELSGQVHVTDTKGNERVQDTSALSITDKPLLIEPVN